MRTRTFRLLAIILAVSVLILGASAQAADNQVGTWKLDVAKSKYSPGPSPKEVTLTMESQADGLKFTIVGTDAEGKPIHIEFSSKYDGTDSPMTGNRRHHQLEEDQRPQHRDGSEERREAHDDHTERRVQGWQEHHRNFRRARHRHFQHGANL